MTGVLLKTCDTNYDKVIDHVEFKQEGTDVGVMAEAYQERYRDPGTIRAGTMASTGYPLGPILWVSFTARDHNNDGHQDLVYLNGGVNTATPGLPGAEASFNLEDRNHDGAYGPPWGWVCVMGVGCVPYQLG